MWIRVLDRCRLATAPFEHIHVSHRCTYVDDAVASVIEDNLHVNVLSLLDQSLHVLGFSVTKIDSNGAELDVREPTSIILIFHIKNINPVKGSSNPETNPSRS